MKIIKKENFKIDKKKNLINKCISITYNSNINGMKLFNSEWKSASKTLGKLNDKVGYRFTFDVITKKQEENDMNTEQFDQIMNSLNSINVRLDNIETRLDKLETRMDNIETRLDNIVAKNNLVE